MLEISFCLLIRNEILKLLSHSMALTHTWLPWVSRKFDNMTDMTDKMFQDVFYVLPFRYGRHIANIFSKSVTSFVRNIWFDLRSFTSFVTTSTFLYKWMLHRVKLLFRSSLSITYDYNVSQRWLFLPASSFPNFLY